MRSFDVIYKEVLKRLNSNGSFPYLIERARDEALYVEFVNSMRLELGVDVGDPVDLKPLSENGTKGVFGYKQHIKAACFDVYADHLRMGFY